MASSSSKEEAEAPSFPEFPREITAAILQKLGPIEMLKRAQRVCTAWRSVCRDPSMWRCIDMRKARDVREDPSNLEIMCRRAVDLSQGQLIDINIESFGSNELLLYISERSGQLRRLQIVCSYDITGDGLIQAIKSVPLLEELCLYYLYYTKIDAKDIEAIGRSCPQLKSFKFSDRWYRKPYDVDCNTEAQAIAQSMPELRHLQLFGSSMTNEGLQAILDGCPHLESLDLRQCFNIHFGGKIGRICTQRIRDLKRPHDSTNDYRFATEIYDCGTSDDDDITGFSDVDLVSDYEDDLEFSGGVSFQMNMITTRICSMTMTKNRRKCRDQKSRHQKSRISGFLYIVSCCSLVLKDYLDE